MVTKSKFEEGLDLLERAIPLLREAYSEQEGSIRQGIIAAISGTVQAKPAPKVYRDTIRVTAKERDAAGRAPRGAAEDLAKEVLRDTHTATWADFEKGADAKGVSFSAVKKAVRRLKDDGVIKQEGFVFTLK